MASSPDIVSTRRPYYTNGIDMETVTLSPKFQVVIPRAIRDAMGLVPGEKLRVLRYGDRVELIPARSAKEMRGYLKGMSTEVEREDDRL